MTGGAKDILAAARAGDHRSVERFVKQRPELVHDWRLIMDASFAGHVEVVRVLLAHGADPNVVSKSAGRYRPLHRVAEYKISAPKTERHVEVVKLLLDAGADPAMRAMRSMMTPLALASIAGAAGIVDVLLQHLPKRDIFAAAAIGDAKRVRALLARDRTLARAADVNGCPAIWYAAASRLHQDDPARAQGLIESARLLLDAGADPNAIGRSVPALYYAVGHTHNLPLATLLLERGASPDSAGSLVHASCSFHFAHLEDGIEWLVDHGANPNVRYGAERQTPLHKAAFLGYVRALDRLLARGANPALKDAAGRTPLDVAREEGKSMAAAALRRHTKRPGTKARAPRRRARC